MAKLADAAGLEPVGRNPVGVQILSPAPELICRLIRPREAWQKTETLAIQDSFLYNIKGKNNK